MKSYSFGYYILKLGDYYRYGDQAYVFAYLHRQGVSEFGNV